MSKQTTLIQALVATLLLAVSAAHAAPVVHTLPRVVVNGKATPQVVAQLPRVVVNGVSLNTLAQQQMMAVAKNKTAAHRG